MTKIVNLYAISMGAVFLVLCGFCPKLAAIVQLMPQSVLGGAAAIVAIILNIVLKKDPNGKEIEPLWD